MCSVDFNEGMFGKSDLEAVRVEAYEISCWITLCKYTVKFADALEYNADSEVCTMCTSTIIARFHMERVTSNMHIMQF